MTEDLIFTLSALLSYIYFYFQIQLSLSLEHYITMDKKLDRLKAKMIESGLVQIQWFTKCRG